MLSTRYKQQRTQSWGSATAPLGRPGASGEKVSAMPDTKSSATRVPSASHPLTRYQENQRLYDYECRIKAAFDSIVPTLKKVSELQHTSDFDARAQAIALQQLGFELPGSILADAWVDRLDMRSLFAWCLFETYRRYCDDFFSNHPLREANDGDEMFQSLLQECGFHTLDISPCADGRLAHVISYVLRLPYKSVRRKSYAGAMFDIEDSLDKWVETEMLRFREGRPNTSGMPTRYLKTVVYHFSSVDPDHEGCAAHGSDGAVAAQAGLDRLLAFQQAVENTYCCGASIDCLLVGLDTDTDAVRIHYPDADNNLSIETFIDAREIFTATETMSASIAVDWVRDYVTGESPAISDGMARLITHFLVNNISQIDYVRNYHGEHYRDSGHAERFIGAGIGFEEVQLRNLTYFAYMNTVEEAAADLDVGIKIFTSLNVSHGLPIPVVVRYDYHGNVPGARERAIAHCHRVMHALDDRYTDLKTSGMLHTLLVVRDISAATRIEVLHSSVKALTAQESH